MRLVKRSVNQDDPGTYHLFYADAEGHPGTDLTFFPWAQMAPARSGYGLSTEVSLAVPPGSLDFWSARLERAAVENAARENRFGQDLIGFADPHGMRLALVESDDASTRRFSPWQESPVPAEYQVRGLDGARLVVRDLAPTAEFISEAMGFTHMASEDGWHRYGVAGGKSGCRVDVREMPNERRGAWGTGSIHHLAWRVDDEAHQLEARERVTEGGARPTPVIDRFWFKSVYFPSPGGVLFELATDGPGFAVDEDRAHLGESLVLPPWLEPDRAAIEHRLPKLTSPT